MRAVHLNFLLTWDASRCKRKRRQTLLGDWIPATLTEAVAAALQGHKCLIHADQRVTSAIGIARGQLTFLVSLGLVEPVVTILRLGIPNGLLGTLELVLNLFLELLKAVRIPRLSRPVVSTFLHSPLLRWWVLNA